jgi:glycerophosphoryl diester phosphodiesterase
MILLDPHARPVVGHRGNRTHAPENTLPSFAEAVALGVDALEFDLHLSRDGVPMVFHDPTLERTTDGRGPLAARTAAELQRLDAGANFSTDGGRTRPWRGRGATIPTFDQLVESVPRTLPLIVELKTPAVAEPLRAAIRRHAIAARVIVAGFDAAATRPLQGAGFALGASQAEVAALLLRALLGRDPGVLPYQALCIPPRWHGLPLPVAALARALRRRGGCTHVWTVNTAAEARALWRAGVQGIISDDPAVILAARAG